MLPHRIHFVTGRLAEPALREVVHHLSSIDTLSHCHFTVQVMPITVAALMSPLWISQRLEVPSDSELIIVPGYCGGDLAPIEEVTGIPVQRGPRDLRRCRNSWGSQSETSTGQKNSTSRSSQKSTKCTRLPLDQILAEAAALAADGADLIDVGCLPGDAWMGVADCVKALKDIGLRVSVDSFHALEIELAVGAGAELVLSVNGANREAAADWGCEVVVIPDSIPTLGGLEETINLLDKQRVSYRVDPILEPIGVGFADSLGRYLTVRRRYPEAEMMMGIGNLTELTDCDSAGVNLLLLGFCQELGIRSVLTTQVINWARSSVKECDIARRLVFHSVRHQVVPKNTTDQLVALRDPRLYVRGDESLRELAAKLRDPSFRIFAEREKLHLMTANFYQQADDPFQLFANALESCSERVDPSHAFYLGYELAKATIALNLGKQYEQDEALDWGFLTVPEESHRLERTSRMRSTRGRDAQE